MLLSHMNSQGASVRKSFQWITDDDRIYLSAMSKTKDQSLILDDHHSLALHSSALQKDIKKVDRVITRSNMKNGRIIDQRFHSFV